MGGWQGRVSMQDTMQCTAHSMQSIIQRILCGVSMQDTMQCTGYSMQGIIQRILYGVSLCTAWQVLYEGQLTDHSHPRLPSQGRATRSHPHLGDVALVIKEEMFFYLIFSYETLLL